MPIESGERIRLRHLVDIFTLVAAAATGAAGYFAGRATDYVTFPPRRGSYQAVVIRHVDGDTLQLGLVVDLGNCRLDGIDAPELPGAAGRASAARLEELAPARTLIETELRGEDKYGRPLVVLHMVYPLAGSINERLVRDGFARSYRGGKKLGGGGKDADRSR